MWSTLAGASVFVARAAGAFAQLALAHLMTLTYWFRLGDGPDRDGGSHPTKRVSPNRCSLSRSADGSARRRASSSWLRSKCRSPSSRGSEEKRTMIRISDGGLGLVIVGISLPLGLASRPAWVCGSPVWRARPAPDLGEVAGIVSPERAPFIPPDVVFR